MSQFITPFVDAIAKVWLEYFKISTSFRYMIFE